MPQELKIKTDHKWRYFKYGHELPNQKKWKKEKNWLELEAFDTMPFVYYRKWYYALDEFMRMSKDHVQGWEGYVGETAFSSVVLKISKDGERYKIGYATT